MRIDDENKVVWCSEELLNWRNSFFDTLNGKAEMMYIVSKVGWGYNLTDSEGVEIASKHWIWSGFEESKITLVKAVIDDYTFKLEEQEYYWRKKKEYSAWFEVAQDTYLAQDEDDGELTLGWLEGAGWKCKFTETEARDLLKDDFDKFEKVECE